MRECSARNLEGNAPPGVIHPPPTRAAQKSEEGLCMAAVIIGTVIEIEALNH